MPFSVMWRDLENATLSKLLGRGVPILHAFSQMRNLRNKTREPCRRRHTHTHTHREREREKEGEACKESLLLAWTFP